MRIQHNIMAMNAYRNYNNNNKALSGNLEKLSSGYKINRAGDDAAGLAISEKMRAQITGLNAAQKNVKDGISLVKTAEGAMQEIQDMLNRMDYLATQSANGTYQDEVDREALQKEVNQLNEEINRIADSANFNGIKLLDGTWDADAKVRAVNTAQKAVDAAQKELDSVGDPATIETQYATVDSAKLITDGVVLPEVAPGTDTPGGATNVGTNTVLETGKIEAQRPSFKVTFNGTSHTMTGDNTADIDLTVDGQTITITEADIKGVYTDKKEGDTVTAEELAKVFATKINDTTGGVGATAGTGATRGDGQFVGNTNKKVVWDVKADGENLVFNMNAAGSAPDQLTGPLNEHYTVTLKAGANGEAADAVTGEKAAQAYSYQTGAVTKATGAGTNGKITVNYTDKDGKATSAEVAYSSTGTQADAEAEAGAIVTELKKNTDLAGLFDISSDANGKITFTAKDAGVSKVSVTGITVDAGGATALAIDTANATEKDGVDAYVPGTVGYTNYGTVEVQPGVPAQANQLANTVIDLSKVGIVDGTKITLGNTEYIFAVGEKSAYKNSEGNVIDLTKYADAAAAGALEDAATQMSQVANDIFSVGHTGADGKVSIQQLEKDGKHVEDGKMTTMKDLMGYIKVSNVDADATKELQDAADAEHKAKVDAAQAKLDEANKNLAAAQGVEGGKPLNLQIGDTSDGFNQLGVKIGSMKTTALGVDGLDIGTADKAAAAIDTIKGAINYVSSIRGDLGAYQNRLEHTANNLSVMAENITDAESTIRDTDVAEEMMSYVKNNILVQSAQAMLAQANQVPQGVLQLLG